VGVERIRLLIFGFNCELIGTRSVPDPGDGLNDPAASSGVSSSLLVRHSVLDTESSRVFWIPAFAGMTNSPQAAGNTTRRD